MIVNFLRIFKPETVLRKVCNVIQMNRIANILNNIQGVNCRIVKPTNAEGRNWMIVVDGGSDILPPEGDPDWPNPFSGITQDAEYDYQVYQRKSGGTYGFDWVRAH